MPIFNNGLVCLTCPEPIEEKFAIYVIATKILCINIKYYQLTGTIAFRPGSISELQIHCIIRLIIRVGTVYCTYIFIFIIIHLFS
jgi:hypothetical protein